MDFNKLKSLVKSKGYTLKSIAEKAGINYMTLYRAEKQNSIETKHLEKIAEILGVSICEFFDETHTPAQANMNINNSGSVKASNISIQQMIGHNRELEQENAILKEKIKGLEEQINLYRQMIEMLKNSKS